MGARGFLLFNLPDVDYGGDKYLDYVYSWQEGDCEDLYGDDWKEYSSLAMENNAPLADEYATLLKKYGYARWKGKT